MSYPTKHEDRCQNHYDKIKSQSLILKIVVPKILRKHYKYIEYQLLLVLVQQEFHPASSRET